METTRRSSYVQGLNLDQASHVDITEWPSENPSQDITMLSVMNLDQASNEDITERPSENPENNITMLSVMSTASNDPEIRDESLMSLGTEISMRSLHDISMMSIGSESSTDTQIAVQSIYKNLQKLKKKLLKRRALNTHQVTPV